MKSPGIFATEIIDDWLSNYYSHLSRHLDPASHPACHPAMEVPDVSTFPAPNHRVHRVQGTPSRQLMGPNEELQIQAPQDRQSHILGEFSRHPIGGVA